MNPPPDLAAILAQAGLTLPPPGAAPTPQPAPSPAPAPSLAAALAAKGLQAPPGAAPSAPSPFSLLQPMASPLGLGGAPGASLLPLARGAPTGEPVRFLPPEATPPKRFGVQPPERLPPASAFLGPSKVNPAELSFAGGGGEQGDAAKRAAIALATPRAVNVPATETPRIAPGRIGAIESSFGAEDAARQELARAQAHQAEDQGVAAAMHAGKLGEQAADVQKKAGERDAFLAAQQAKIDKLSEEAANGKIDPDNWWKHQGTGQKIGYAIAAGLGGFLEGFRGTPNRALEQIQGHINADIQAQREAIEGKKGRVRDMQGLLAETYRRFGNMEQAEAAARVLALQQVDSEQQAYAASSNSEKVLAESKVMSAQNQAAQQKELASLYTFTPAHTAAAGGATPQDMARARALYDKALEAGKNVSYQDALAQAVGERLGVGAFGSNTFGKDAKTGAAKENPQIADQIAVADQAIKNIDALRGPGGELPGTGLVSRNLSPHSGLKSTEARQLHGALWTLAEAVAHANGQRGNEAVQSNLEAIAGNGSQADIDAGIARAKAIIRSRAQGGGGATESGGSGVQYVPIEGGDE